VTSVRVEFVIDNLSITFNNFVCNTISNRIERNLVVSSIKPKTADVMFPRSNIAIHGGIFNNQNFQTNRTFKGALWDPWGLFFIHLTPESEISYYKGMNSGWMKVGWNFLHCFSA
jgi:hypothetical protein